MKKKQKTRLKSCLVPSFCQEGFNLYFFHRQKRVILITRITSDLDRISMQREFSESVEWNTVCY